MPKEGSDLVLIEGDVKAVHSWPAKGLKNLHQVLHTHPRNQAWMLTFKEGVWEGMNEGMIHTRLSWTLSPRLFL